MFVRENKHSKIDLNNFSIFYLDFSVLRLFKFHIKCHLKFY